MRKPQALTCFVLLFTLRAVPCLAQQPARDVAVRKSGTAVITGKVTADDPSGRPLHMAMVSLVNTADQDRPLTATDEAGRFEFRGLPAGRFTVNVNRPAYVSTSY